MKTRKLITLHERAILEAELMHECNRKLNECRANWHLVIQQPDSITALAYRKEDILRSIDKYERIKQRLCCWYTQTSTRIHNLTIQPIC